MKYIILSILLLYSFTSQAQSEEFVLGGVTSAFWLKGSVVDIEGDVAVVGVPKGVGRTASSGFVYVYEFNGEQWVMVSKLIPDEINNGDLFGGDVEISQGRIIVGAEQASRVVDGVAVIHSGLVIVFEKVEGEWTQTASLVPSIVEEEDHFGIQVTTGLNRIFASVGDYGESESGFFGGVFVFEFINGSWVETDFIKGSEDLNTRGLFGFWDMSVSGDTLVIPSVFTQDDVSTTDVYIFRLIENSWQFEHKIISPTSDDWFGNSLSVNGNRLLIGAPNEAESLGAAYLYERIGGMWSMSKKFENTGTGRSTYFGDGVVLGLDQLAIGSTHETYSGEDVDEGQVFIYNFDGENWQLVETLKADGEVGHNDFGESLALDHDRLIVGAPYSGVRAGAAYVYTIEPNSQQLPINAGLNGTWFNPDTSGQGLFLDVSPVADFSFLGWFTFDNEMALDDELGQIGADGQRWLVGAGDIDQINSSINYNLYYAYDGLFDDSREVLVSSTETYGSLTLEFQSCSTALVTYHLFEQGISNSYPVYRPVAESGELCSALAAENAAEILPDDDFDYSLNGAWFNPETPGQGFFIDKFKGVDTAFMGWFTFDTALQSPAPIVSVGSAGQRWVVGTGSVDEIDANVLNYQLYYTYGGLFDDPVDVSVVEPGTYGDLRIEFTDCDHANVEYSIDSENLSGAFSMIRAVPNGEVCKSVY